MWTHAVIAPTRCSWTPLVRCPLNKNYEISSLDMYIRFSVEGFTFLA